MAVQKNQVVVVGNIGIDTNVYFHGNGPDFSVEANFTRNIDLVGQAGGYASRGYTCLGYQTAFVGYVGADFAGDHIRKTLERDGIDTRGMLNDPEGTSRSINFMYADGGRRNFYDGKGHMHLEPPLEQLTRILQGARLAHFNIPNWARKLLAAARSACACIACDIQDVVDVHDPYRLDFINNADFLFFSAVNQADPGFLIGQYLEINPNLVILSGMGSRGCAFGNRDGISYFPAVEMDLPVVDTNGAGDMLAVGFLTAHLLEGRGLEESIRRGQIAARYKCAQMASSDNLITREILDHYDALS